MFLGPLVFFATGLSHAGGFLQYVFQRGYEPANSRADVVLVTSSQMAIYLGTQFLTAIVFASSGNLVKHIWLLFGVLVWTAGVVGTSFTTSYDQLLGVYTSLVGLGASILYWGPLAIAMKSQKDTLIMLAFASLGELFHFWVVSGYLTLPLWRQTLQILGGVGGGVMITSVLLSLIFTKPKQSSSTKTAQKPVFLTIGFGILVLAALCFNVVSNTPYQHLVTFLTYERGIDEYYVTMVMGTFSIAGLVGRLLPLPILGLYDDSLYLLILTTLVTILVPSGWFLIQDFIGALLFAVFAGLTSSLQSSFLMATVAKISDSPFAMTPLSVISMGFACMVSGYVYAEILLTGGFHVASGFLVGFQSLSFLLTAIAYILI